MAKKTNIASSGYTAIQVGGVIPSDGKDGPVIPPGRKDEPHRRPAEPPRKPGKGQTVNVRRGNARVGVQADTIVGDITIQI